MANRWAKERIGVKIIGAKRSAVIVTAGKISVRDRRPDVYLIFCSRWSFCINKKGKAVSTKESIELQHRNLYNILFLHKEEIGNKNTGAELIDR